MTTLQNLFFDRYFPILGEPLQGDAPLTPAGLNPALVALDLMGHLLRVHTTSTILKFSASGGLTLLSTIGRLCQPASPPPLLAAVVRFLRQLVFAKIGEKWWVSFILHHNMLDPVINVYRSVCHKDNCLNSAILHIFQLLSDVCLSFSFLVREMTHVSHDSKAFMT